MAAGNKGSRSGMRQDKVGALHYTSFAQLESIGHAFTLFGEGLLEQLSLEPPLVQKPR